MPRGVGVRRTNPVKQMQNQISNIEHNSRSLLPTAASFAGDIPRSTSR